MSHRITVIGAGFAGLTAVRTLRATDPDCEITVLAPRAELVFLPSLIWIPSGLRKPEDLVVALQPFLRRMRVDFHAGSALGLKDRGRTVITEGGEITNDGLIVASGGRFLRKLPGIEHAITPCEGIPAAVALRERLRAMHGGAIAFGFASNPQEPGAMRGGPIFEFLFGVDTLLRRQARRERFQLTFFSPAAQPGNRLGPTAVQRLMDHMAKRAISTHLGHKLKALEADRVITEGGEIPADLIVFMPGMTGNAWLDQSGLARSPGGLLQADALCRVAGSDRVYVAGDAGSFPGPDWLPRQAHMADLQARAAARNLIADLQGGTPSETFRPELICIVDSLDRGMLVRRTPSGGQVLPPLRVAHWSKRVFERWYLRQYR